MEAQLGAGVHQNDNLFPENKTEQALSEDLAIKPQIRSTTQATETTVDTSIIPATTYTLSTSSMLKPTTAIEVVALSSSKSSTPVRISTTKLSKSRPIPSSIQATNLLIGNSKPTLQPTVLAPYWKDALDIYISRLHPRDRELVLRVEDVSFDKELLGAIFEPLRKSYQKDGFQRFLKRINPMMSHIRSFGVVADVATQADANMAGLIWSGIRLALEVHLQHTYSFCQRN
jgi:hypothetical protein